MTVLVSRRDCSRASHYSVTTLRSRCVESSPLHNDGGVIVCCSKHGVCLHEFVMAALMNPVNVLMKMNLEEADRRERVSHGDDRLSKVTIGIW